MLKKWGECIKIKRGQRDWGEVQTSSNGVGLG